MRRGILKYLAVVGMAAILAGCGFHLRGTDALPFATASVEASGESLLAPSLRQALKDQGKLADKSEAAELRIQITQEARSKSILSLSGGGRVREYRLEYHLTVAVVDRNGLEVVAPFPVQLLRDYSYSDDQVLAKQAEEAALYRAMEQEAQRQVLRRLSYLKRP